MAPSSGAVWLSHAIVLAHGPGEEALRHPSFDRDGGPLRQGTDGVTQARWAERHQEPLEQCPCPDTGVQNSGNRPMDVAMQAAMSNRRASMAGARFG